MEKRKESSLGDQPGRGKGECTAVVGSTVYLS